MILEKSCHIGKTIRIFPSRLILCFVCILSIYIFAELSFKSQKRYPNSISADDVTQDKDRLIAMLIDRKLQFNNSNDEGLKNVFSDFIVTMEEKINKLEKRIKELEVSIKQKKTESEKTQNNVKGNSLDNPDCPIPSFEGFSACPGKIQWMKERWTSDKCYGEWGVDGSECSIVKYLSEVESWCPRLSNAPKTPPDSKNNTVKVKMRADFSDLYQRFEGDKHFDWIALRIRRMEWKWRNASHELAFKPYYQKWQKKSILIHLGLLAEENGWNIAKNAFSGGPLGELVQWSDLITSLYVLGHDITLTVTTLDLRKELQSQLDSVTSINCPLQGAVFDLIYTDIGGLKMMKKAMGSKFHLLKCSMRVVDSFGTEPEYNFPSYADRKKMKSEWGKWNFFPKQFNTMFPHTPDNTFLGFVIETIDNVNSSVPRRNIAVVYGKRDAFWKGKRPYLDAIHDVTEIHGTVSKDEKHQYVPSYVINHGVLPGKELHELLLSSKIFIGLGFPYEGPAPLEAIADGAVFLNPVFKKDSQLYHEAAKFFTKKPTNRKLSSQHPYAQNFIGSPHVRTIDLDNLEDVKNIVREIISNPRVEGYMPYEFTCYGMLERVGFLVEKQDFCSEKKAWPPLSSLKIVVTDASSSCADACLEQGAVCEPHFFPDINQRSTFKMLDIQCDKYESPKVSQEEIDYPSYKDNTCYIQGNQKLFSCAGRHTDTKRICPCRDYVKGQVAMCKDCFT